ncbi:MAG: DUF4342 domain-containing protein [Nitrososphaerota archaeon]
MIIDYWLALKKIRRSEFGLAKVLLSIPVTWGAAGAATLVFLASWLAALEVIVRIVTRCTIEVEKTSDKLV